ncbi:MAG: hypothetical protein AB3N14_16745 [Flavobacteriaceae bacterium]
MRYIAVFIIIIALGCKGKHKGLQKSGKTETVSEELTLVLSDNYGGAEQQEIQVIRSKGALKNFFTEINKTRKPGIPVPKIDFSKEMVVIYCSGKTTDAKIPGLYMISESDDKLTLGVKKQNLEETTSSAVLVPFGLYTMAITDKEVVLEQ